MTKSRRFSRSRGLVEKTRMTSSAAAAFVSEGGLKMRRFGRLLGHHGQSAGGLVLRTGWWRRAVRRCDEVPEMFGAETILMDRATDRRIFDRTVPDQRFQALFPQVRSADLRNPSPGNKKGRHHDPRREVVGLRAEGRGSQPVVHVLNYAQPVIIRV